MPIKYKLHCASVQLFMQILPKVSIIGIIGWTRKYVNANGISIIKTLPVNGQ
jgi:hypothetical protein